MVKPQKFVFWSVLFIIILSAMYVFLHSNILNPKLGIIKGELGYPADFNPARRVCAEKFSDKSKTYCIKTSDGQNDYQINLPVGDYYVFSSLLNPEALGTSFSKNYKAYWDQMVLCKGMTSECDIPRNHIPTKVTVFSGSIISHISPDDWYDSKQF